MKESWELAEDFWGKYMDNEPVAWIFVLDGCRNVTLDEDASDETRHNGIPLYTHQAKTLTEDEITKEIYQMTNVSDKTEECIIVSYEALQGFANSLLRKA